MEKWMCLGTLAVAGLMLLLFVLDLVLAFPFDRLDWSVDIIGILAAGLIGYTAWQSYQEFK